MRWKLLMQPLVGVVLAGSLPAGAAAAAPAVVDPTEVAAQGLSRWGECPALPEGATRDPRQQCALLRVPLDYRHPRGRTITVAVSRIATAKPETRRGILLFNPGGPGGQGLDLPSGAAGGLPAEVLDRYDLVGFDPRGIGYSTPVTCGLDVTDPALNELVLPYPAADGSIERNVEFGRATARSCAEQSGSVIGHITTANTARDMDRIRAALGEPKLSYLGWSYGTYLGAVYTQLFPDRSDRIILDSAVDPDKVWYGIWRSFNSAVDLRFPDVASFAANRNDEYELGATPEQVRAFYLDLTARLDASPIQDDEVGLLWTGNFLREITRSYLYDDFSLMDLPIIYWYVNQLSLLPPGEPAPVFAAGITETLNVLSGRLRGRQPVFPSVPEDNGVAALYAVACGDVTWSHNVRAYARNVAADRVAYPLTAGMPGNVWPCTFWSPAIEPPVRVTSDGPRNVLILQNERDPATSLESALGLRAALGQRAAMVTVDAGGHGVYGWGTCGDDAANTLLITGELPAGDQACSRPGPEELDPDPGTEPSGGSSAADSSAGSSARSVAAQRRAGAPKPIVPAGPLVPALVGARG